MKISKNETLWLKSEGAKTLINLGVKHRDHIIDFGCGEGRYTIPLSNIVGKEGCVYAVERDEKAMAVLKERLPLFSTTGAIKFLEIGDLEITTTISDNTIDSIFVFDVLQYVKDWNSLFSYFFRVLKPNGIIYIYPAAVPHPGDVDIELVLSKMEKAKFRFMGSTKLRMMHNVDMVNDIVYSFCKK